MIVFRMPWEYLDKNASEAHKAFYEQTKGVLQEIVDGTRQYIVLPSDTDDRGNKLFDIEILNDCVNNFVIQENK
jgi:hypothetical protein